ncbi:hypothetical protein [Ochrovirga pacifica]|uniref:hypothetical protein n=1 Tax=Ochrovirga pacifica TaxID=1042376 RepID=UPI0002D91951|nr:hypothetical protein [Ochrovirga pacifica]
MELKNSKGWYRLDSLPKVLNDAVELANRWQYQIPWFPKMDELNPESVYVYPWSIYCNGIDPTGTELIFVIPNDKIIYYLGTKM